MKKTGALILAFLLLTALLSCQKKDPDQPSWQPGTPGVATATDQWPAAVYDPLGIPAFSDGQLDFCVPGPDGTVYLSCTREAFLAYMETLRDASFRPDDMSTVNAAEDMWGSFEIYMPRSGGRYSVSCTFSFENEGEGMLLSQYDEASQKNREFSFNMSLSLREHEEETKAVDTESLRPLGLNASDFLTEDALSFSFQIYTEEPYKGIGTIGYPFDTDIDEDLFYTVAGKLIDACCAASDTGNIESLSKKEQTAEQAKADRSTTWIYTKDGKNYLFLMIGSFGFGGNIGVSITSAD